MSNVELAVALARRGWPVFPVGANKRPIIKDWPNRASTDETTIRALWRSYPAALVAIVTGRRSGLFVVDVDADDEHPIHDKLDPTLVVWTPRGGRHYYYTMPENLDDDDVLRNTQKADRCLGYGDVDTRGTGGYVVAPGCVVGDGKAYELVVDVEPMPIPAWVLEAMRAYKRQPVATQKAIMRPMVHGPDRGAALRRARAYVSKMSPAISGSGGHSATMAVARACVTGFGLSEGETLEVLQEYNGRCTPPWSEKELQHKAHEAATKPDPKGNAIGHMLASSDGVQVIGGDFIFDETALKASEVVAVEDVRKGKAFCRLPERDDADTWELFEQVVRLGGLCETFSSWVLAGADYPQPGLTLGALIALGSAMCGRRWTYERATSSQIVVNVAETATGKGRPQGALLQALGASWGRLCGPNELSSTVSTVARIETATYAGHGLLMVLDEYGPRLKSLLDSRSGHRSDTRSLLLAMATIGTGTYVAATSMARGGQDRVIIAPSLSILGSSTHTALHDAVGQMSVDDGFMGRHLWFEALSTLPRRQRPAPTSRDVPAAVIAAIDGWRREHEEWVKANPHPDTTDANALRIYVPDEAQDAGGAAMLAQYQDACDERRRNPVAGDVPAALLGRCAEQAVRVALVLAVLRAEPGSWPVVDEDVARCAIAVAEASSGIVARGMRDHQAPRWDDPAGQVAAVEAAILSSADADGWANRSDVLRACRRLRAADVDDACERLQNEDRLEVAKRMTRGRPMLCLRLVE